MTIYDSKPALSERDWVYDPDRTVVHENMPGYAYDGYAPQQQAYPHQMIPVPTPSQAIKRHPKTGQPIIITNQSTPVIIRPKYKPNQFRRRGAPQYEIVNQQRFPEPQTFMR